MIQNKKINKKQKNTDITRFKEKYFEMYDDIKSPTHKVVDW